MKGSGFLKYLLSPSQQPEKRIEGWVPYFGFVRGGSWVEDKTWVDLKHRTGG